MVELTHRWYVWLALTTLLGAWIYIRHRTAAYDWLAENLEALEEDDRLKALQLAFGPIPEALSAEQWIQSKKHRLLFLGYIVTLAVAFPFIPILLSPKPTKNLQDLLLKEPKPLNEEQKSPSSTTTNTFNFPGKADPGTPPQTSTVATDPPMATDPPVVTDPPKGPGSGNPPPGTQKPLNSPISMRVRSGREGIIRQTFVNPGDHVTKGQVIAELTCDDLEDRLAETNKAQRQKLLELKALRSSDERELAISNLEIQEAKASLDRATNRKKLIDSLKAQGASTGEQVSIAESDVELGRTLFSLAQEKQSLAKANIESRRQRAMSDEHAMEVQIRTLQARLRLCKVTAPADGVLESILEAGEYTGGTAGQPVAMLKRIPINKINPR